ncbi:signal recognition particle-docking protein FtsY [Oxynema aestuarii]|uniref:Signal recognition particle receptor FtsY n=1 Tax=Oxynema aestuarii AP17 TaxID=2064643 RepID=A0A6H1U1C5_9CYAN|nr:signal recognition particle-docking protein FtsY [Oxynema aestuarii]QIZ72678.1 signal recognition particle-docking protein FtsY [Oxynema aestuarii AP17]
MVFNWFRRQFDDRAQKSEAKTTESEPAQPEETTPSAEEESTDEEEVDYLTWAKAAYKNIQQQKGVSTEPEPEAEPEAVEAQSEPELEPEAVEAEAQPEPEAEPEAVEAQPEPETEPEAVEAQPEPEAEPEAVEAQPEPEAEPEAVEAQPEPEPEPAPTSFLARAEAERQSRLQRVAESAVEVVEEEEEFEESAAAREIWPTRHPELAFDEGFLWSAEVLAAQGRRPDEISVEEITWLQKLRQGLDKTRRSLINQLRAIVGQGPLNRDAVMEIEAALLQADVGIAATDYIIEALQEKMREEALPPDLAIAYLKRIIGDLLDRPTQELEKPFLVPEKDRLNIWLVTGVNGAGKTTTIGKIAHLAKKSDYKCLIAAADTFRAAAVEQMKVWGQRSGVEVIANPGKNTDPAAVVFDAIAAAQSRGTELLIVDTAGRLQNKKNLMDELSKIRRIINKKAPDAIVESLLVLDATLGQNGLNQAQVFSEAVNLSGAILTKLDGTAKGGIALAVVQQMNLPIRFIGAGEGIEDLRPFSSYEFVEALISG